MGYYQSRQLRMRKLFATLRLTEGVRSLVVRQQEWWTAQVDTRTAFFSNLSKNWEGV